MNTIQKQIQYEQIINKSKFIAIIKPVHNKEQIIPILEETKQQYKNATHYCYAYIIDGEQRCSDDKEPSKTAGMPILNVLQNQDLNHIICIIVRYFGGIKLGAGGLVRAYSSTTSLALQTANIIPLEKNYIIDITFPYTSIKQIDYLLKDYEITDKHYQENIHYQIKIKEEQAHNLEQSLIPYINTISRKEETK